MRNKVYKLYGFLVAVCLIVSMISPASAVPIIPDPGVSTDKSSICCGDEITVVVPVKNLRSVTKYLHIDIVIKNPSGTKIVDDSKPETIAAYASKTFRYTYTIPEPCTNFGTYTVSVKVMEGSSLHDSDTTTFQVNDCNGGDEGCDTQLTFDTSKQDRPSMTYANSHFYVAYQSHETGSSYDGDIYIKKFDSNWNEVKKKRITNDPDYQNSPSLVFANNKLYVAFITNHQGATWNDYDVYLKEYDSNLNYISGGRRYLTELQSCQDMPSLFYKDGYFYLAYQSWERGSSYNGDIYIKKFNSVWNEIKKVRVTSETSVQDRPSVIYVNGYLYIAYYSKETGNRDIFVKRLDTSLNLQSWKKQVTSESSSQSYPSINFVNNEYAIAYASNEGGTLGIYMKKYDSNWAFIEKVKVIDDGSVHEKRPSMVHALGDYQLAYVRYLGGSDDFNIYSTPEVCPSDEEPSPEITKVTYPTTCVNEDEYATISVTVRNNGGASSKGYISVSFPNDEYIPESDVSGTGNGYNELFPKGYCPLWNSDDERITAIDPLVELFEENWGEGQQETISMKVKPNSGSDEIVFYVRAALKNDADGDYERDPTYSGDIDQQGWPAERHVIEVCSGECMADVWFKGTATTDETNEPRTCYGSYYCKVCVDEIPDTFNYPVQKGEEYTVAYGQDPKYIKSGDKLEVYGIYYRTCGPLQCVGLIGATSDPYYVKKIEENKPDLIVSSINFNPDPANKYDEVIVYVTVKNQGNGDAGPHYEFLGYPDRYTILKEWYCSGLKSGASRTFTHSLKNVQHSDTYEACADWGQAVQESDDDNNCLTAYLEVEESEGKPNLIIESILPDISNPKEGDKIKFTVRTKNKGEGDAGAFYIYYYIDGSYKDRDDISYGLSAGSTRSNYFYWTADKCGDVQVKAWADATDKVDEGSDEGDNKRIETVSINCPSGSLTVTIYPSEVRSQARWKLTSGPDTSWHSGGDTISNIPVGSRTIQFNDVSGWTKPSDIAVAINEGSNSKSGTYTQNSGSLMVRIYPSEVRRQARWRLTSGSDTSWHASGYTISNIPVGSRTIQFNDVSGWTKPSDIAVAINEGSNSKSGTYTQNSGSLMVRIYPSEVRRQARWRLTSGSDTSWHASGYTISNIPVGSRTIQFNDVSGWTKPSDIAVAINEGSNSKSGTYTQNSGSLMVRIYPSEVRRQARWRLTSGSDTSWHASGYTISNIPVGSRTIQFNDVSGWTKPSDIAVAINGGSNSESGTYTQKSGSLTVTIYPSGVRTDARWKLASGSDTNWHSSGYTISNIPVGSRIIQFNDITGWTKPPDMAMSINEGSNSESGTYTSNAVNYIHLAQAARFRAATMEAIWIYYKEQGDQKTLDDEVEKSINEAVQKGWDEFKDAIIPNPKTGNPAIDGFIDLAGLLSSGHQAATGDNEITNMVDVIWEMGASIVDANDRQAAALGLRHACIVGPYPPDTKTCYKCCEYRQNSNDLFLYIKWVNCEAKAWEDEDMTKVKTMLKREAWRLGYMDSKMRYTGMTSRYYNKIGILKELSDIPVMANKGRNNTEMMQIFSLYSIAGGGAEDILEEYNKGLRKGSAIANCPVNLHAYDSIGRHVGANESGGVDLEIPGAFYSGIDSHPQIIQIFGTTDYYFVVEALDQGEFNLTTESSTYEETTSVQYEHVAVGNDTNAIINLSKEGYAIDIDEDGDGITDYTVNPTSVETNHPPEISIIAIPDDAIFKGDISIDYILKDLDNDTCNISARYSTDQMIWHDATGSGGDGTIELSSSADGVTHTYVWASSIDLPDISSILYFEIRPNDGMTDGIHGISNAFYVGEVTASFTYSPSNPSISKHVIFAAYASIGKITNYTWNFDDGTNVSTAEPIIIHSYTSEDTYTVNLTVTDNEGSTNTTSKKITVGDIYKPPIQLHTGWNLISIPLVPEDSNIDSVFSSISGNYSVVWTTTSTGGWKSSDQAFGKLTDITVDKGYLIYMTAPDTLVIEGTEPASTTINLASGWNLVGHPSQTTRSITDVLSGVSYDVVWTTTSTGGWKSSDQAFGRLTDMSPGNGYMIYAPVSGSYTVN